MPHGAVQDRDGELERIKSVEGAAPLAAAVAADALAHSLPGLNLLLAPASELFGATVRLWSAQASERDCPTCHDMHGIQIAGALLAHAPAPCPSQQLLDMRN